MKSTQDTDGGPYGHGPIVARSAAAAPAWLKPNTEPGLTYCGEDGGALTCVGVSTVSPSQEDAEDEASDAATEAVAFELGKRITDKQWLAAIPPIYTVARDAKLAALNRDSLSTQARRDVRDGRRAVAHAMKGVTPVGRYWEAMDARDGRRYVAFVQVKLAAADAAKLIESYTKPKAALGATAVSFFPELAWKFPKVTKGAVVLSLEAGSLQQLGVAEKSVITSVDGREIADAEAFATIIVQERDVMTERGGAFRIMVQADAGEPREFSQTFPGRVIEVPIDRSSGKHRGGTGGTSGGVNIWDRTGGGKSGRDDPTQ
jgi:hypothetical protein